MENIPLRKAAEAVARLLAGAGHTVYFVGGCVRDRLLGYPVKDIDIATSARPDEVLRLFPDAWEVGAALRGDGGVVLGGGVGVFDGHGGDIRLAGEDLGSHLASGHAQIIVADGQGRHAAAGADTLLAADSGNTGGHQDVGDGLGVGGGDVIGGEIDHIRVVSGGLSHGRHVIGVGEGKFPGLNALVGQAGRHFLDLVAGVGLGGAEQQGDLLGLGEPLGDHIGLLAQVSQIGGAGDVAAYGAVEIVKIQGHAVSGDGGAQNGNVGSRGSGGGRGGGGVGHDQVHALGNKAVDDRAAVVGLAGGVLVFKLHLAGEGFIQSVNKTLGCSVQRGVLHQLADADLIGGALGGGIVRAGGGCLRLGAAAGGKGQRHGRSQNKSEQFLFHSDLLLLSVSGRIHKVGCLPKNKGGSVRGTEPPRV